MNKPLTIGKLSNENSLTILENLQKSTEELLNFIASSDKLNRDPSVQVLLKNSIVKVENFKETLESMSSYVKECIKQDSITPKQHYFDVILDGKRQNGVRAACQEELLKIYEACGNHCEILREYDENKKLLKQYDERPKTKVVKPGISLVVDDLDERTDAKIPSDFISDPGFIKRSIEKNNALVKEQMRNGIVKADLSGNVDQEHWTEIYDKERDGMFPVEDEEENNKVEKKTENTKAKNSKSKNKNNKPKKTDSKKRNRQKVVTTVESGSDDYDPIPMGK